LVEGDGNTYLLMNVLLVCVLMILETVELNEWTCQNCCTLWAFHL